MRRFSTNLLFSYNRKDLFVDIFIRYSCHFNVVFFFYFRGNKSPINLKFNRYIFWNILDDFDRNRKFTKRFNKTIARVH